MCLLLDFYHLTMTSGGISPEAPGSPSQVVRAWGPASEGGRLGKSWGSQSCGLEGWGKLT